MAFDESFVGETFARMKRVLENPHASAHAKKVAREKISAIKKKFRVPKGM